MNTGTSTSSISEHSCFEELLNSVFSEMISVFFRPKTQSGVGLVAKINERRGGKSMGAEGILIDAWPRSRSAIAFQPKRKRLEPRPRRPDPSGGPAWHVRLRLPPPAARAPLSLSLIRSISFKAPTPTTPLQFRRPCMCYLSKLTPTNQVSSSQIHKSAGHE